jgi:hypothetical protein
MSQINVNVVAPLGYTGVEVGNDNYVKLFDNSGTTVFQSSAGPLSMGAGYVLTVPTSTTLNIL